MKSKALQVFLSLFILSFVVINWNSVSWVFNYRVVESLVYDFFNPYPDTALALVSSNKTTITNLVPVNGDKPAKTTIEKVYPYSDRENSLQIAKIGVDTPVVIAKSTNKAALAKDLDKGATYYPGSVLPGEDGQMVILGHSAPPNWPKIKHDYIFSDLQGLAVGDEIILHFNNRQYTYKVLGSQVIARGADVPESKLDANILTLITCWPPGHDYQRFAVTAELIEI